MIRSISVLGLAGVLFLVPTFIPGFSSIVCSQTKDTSFSSSGNPIIRHKYTADPAALVYNGKVYLYTGHDEAPPNRESYIMNDWLCFSSEDMVHWTEHPSPLKVKDFAWAK